MYLLKIGLPSPAKMLCKLYVLYILYHFHFGYNAAQSPQRRLKIMKFRCCAVLDQLSYRVY